MKDFDVAIVGGGPAGSTCGSLLRKYAPNLNVLILEREFFPRDHVGESQLPPIGKILDEMGCWDKIEAAQFPIKIGATYRWGQTDDLWDFELYPAAHFKDEPRPAKYEGQRQRTAFQVDRAKYDQILLDHAESLGCEVRQGTKVGEILHSDGQVDGLKLADCTTVKARYYIDATGSSGFLRRALNVPIEQPTSLQNVAFWDYWTDAEWAITIGKGGTRVQVMSIGYGWIWFIPISPTRTSIGLVVPAQYYKERKISPSELYAEALQKDPMIRDLIKHAKAEGPVHSTKDWSYVASQMAGPNWFLAGESGGFADPILAAGMTMAHAAGREAAYTIAALDAGELDRNWLFEQYTEQQRTRVIQHIRFADFWYAANGCFTDLKEFTREIAKDAGLELDANQAFQWLGTGGFVSENVGNGVAGFPLGAVKDTVELMLGQRAQLETPDYNVLKLNLDGAERVSFARYREGQIIPEERYVRDGKMLPLNGIYRLLIDLISQRGAIDFVVKSMIDQLIQKRVCRSTETALEYGMGYLEAMVRDKWVIGEFIEGGPRLNYDLPRFASSIRPNKDMRVFETAGTP
jgi:flavin-dependent dehydrogenase